MELQTAPYFMFLGAIAIVYATLPPRWRVTLLLCASLVFYSFSGIAYLAMFAALCALNYAAALRLSRAEDESRRTLVFALILALDLGILISFKYFLPYIDSQFSPSSSSLATHAGLRLVAPLGISYFTFQMIAVTTDAYRRDWRLDAGWSQFALFGFFFPQITSGPIPRAERLLPQLTAGGAATSEDVAVGVRMISYGLFKKFVVANRLNDYVAEIFAAPGQALSLHYSTLPTILGCIFNLLNLYADFSSYVDIAIGSARLLGIRLDRNFDRPLTSTSVSEIWRRWHMTLSFWLRDYLFMPLLISLGNFGNWGVIFALLLTFAICGLWHAATWPYLIFGLVQGVAMAVELLSKRWRSRRLKRVPAYPVRFAGWLYAMSFFVLSEVFFRASSLGNAAMVFNRLIALRPLDGAEDLFAHKGPYDFALYFVAIGAWGAVSHFYRRDTLPTPAFALGCGLLTLFLGRLGGAQFIYAGF